MWASDLFKLRLREDFQCQTRGHGRLPCKVFDGHLMVGQKQARGPHAGKASGEETARTMPDGGESAGPLEEQWGVWRGRNE